MNFLSLKPSAFGLDFSDLSLKIAKLKKKRKFLLLTSWGEIEIKPGIIEMGEIKNEKALVEVIKEGLKKVNGEKLRTKNVIASLPEKKAFLQVIQMPKMEKEELKTAILFEAENYIPLPIEEVYLDFQIIPPVHNSLDHFDILIAALPKNTVNPYFSCLQKAGLFPVALEIESQSISRALIKNSLSPFPVLIIDFGKTRTSFIIFSGHSLRFTSSNSISSQEITEAIAKTLKLELSEAEKLKLKYGLPLTTFRESSLGRQKPQKVVRGLELPEKISEAIIPVLTDLVKQIKRYIDYYQTYASHEHLPPNGKLIEKIILCGGGANLKGLADFLSTELGIPAELGNPWLNILPKPLKQIPKLSFEESLSYTTALGLALKGIIYD